MTVKDRDGHYNRLGGQHGGWNIIKVQMLINKLANVYQVRSEPSSLLKLEILPPHADWLYYWLVAILSQSCLAWQLYGSLTWLEMIFALFYLQFEIV